MARSLKPPPLNWSAIGLLAMLGLLVVLGLAANGASPLEWFQSLGFLVAMLSFAALWKLTLREVQTAPPPTSRQRAWNAVVFCVWLAAVLLAAWCWRTGAWPGVKQ